MSPAGVSPFVVMLPLAETPLVVTVPVAVTFAPATFPVAVRLFALTLPAAVISLAVTAPVAATVLAVTAPLAAKVRAETFPAAVIFPFTASFDVPEFAPPMPIPPAGLWLITESPTLVDVVNTGMLPGVPIPIIGARDGGHMTDAPFVERAAGDLEREATQSGGGGTTLCAAQTVAMARTT